MSEDAGNSFLPSDKSLTLSKSLADSLNMGFDWEEVKKLAENLHSIYFQEIVEKLELDLTDVKFNSGATRKICAFATPDSQRSGAVFFDEQFDFWLMDICFLNSITACKILSEKEWKELDELFRLTLDSFFNAYLHEPLSQKIKPWLHKYSDCLRLGHDLSKGMITFIICHEIAHIHLGHLKEKESPKIEFAADDLAFTYFLKIVNHKSQSGYLNFDNKFFAVPILLFNYFSQLEKYHFTKTGVLPNRETHPNPIDRAEKLFIRLKAMENEQADYFLDGFFLGLKDLIDSLNLPKTL